jgi:hypothetical protein
MPLVPGVLGYPNLLKNKKVVEKTVNINFLKGFECRWTRHTRHNGSIFYTLRAHLLVARILHKAAPIKTPFFDPIPCPTEYVAVPIAAIPYILPNLWPVLNIYVSIDVPKTPKF